MPFSECVPMTVGVSLGHSAMSAQMSGLRESGHGWAIYDHLFESPSLKSELHCRSEFELKLPIAEIQPS
jgi:hypothetical protein